MLKPKGETPAEVLPEPTIPVVEGERETGLYVIRATRASGFRRGGLFFNEKEWTVVKDPLNTQLSEPLLTVVSVDDPEFTKKVGPLKISNPELLPGYDAKTEAQRLRDGLLGNAESAAAEIESLNKEIAALREENDSLRAENGELLRTAEPPDDGIPGGGRPDDKMTGKTQIPDEGKMGTGQTGIKK